MNGIYSGTVEGNQDPEKRGRLKIRVPLVYGNVESKFGSIPLNDLPWALPSGLPSGGSPQSGGMDWLPEVGDQVFVSFLDGEPEKPVWSWGNQSKSQAESFGFNTYEDGRPIRGALTRYGHTLEFNNGGVLLTTGKGYSIILSDGSSGAQDGSVSLATPKANFFSITDEDDSGIIFLNHDLYLQIADQFYAKSESIVFETTTGDFNLNAGLDITMQAARNIDVQSEGTTNIEAALTAVIKGTVGLTLETEGVLQHNFGTMRLGTGANQPLVLGSLFVTLINSLIVYIDAHTHGNGNNGSPTSPPIVPISLVLLPQLPGILSQTVTTQ